ncbi:Polysaccharide chain length determinant N-terminal domain-containing protein [Vibrio crassostreae]|uniref:hypothetical protein n=1 Tax=Vibrio crassostreae TaxID=246167 RepID=UPI001B305D77|nr:hypothetical protein [Vibrio crassostreae]CAK2025219.1 Polysaccharide chain length determinant N-terminal domain-containing protein [Vibrio crassostreae]CAK2027156.1 Polysaccharide chain length determinant N-terminal domain-containing protein [Vibrio crassostreae]CAK2029027.1 Polysaccharide chain length determinant N-terminal domain-containing protein [Vibrio crassostreae]CAK2029803.1 Polysaccharide chain length determinant N-terminal domain-containing protein [Vibrio crassostreae]CAK203507
MFLNSFIKELLSKSKLICFSTILFLAIAVVASLNSEEKWTSKSILIEPSFNQISSYFLVMKSLSSVDSTPNNGIDRKYIFGSFIDEVVSVDNKRQYLKSIDMDMTETEADKTIRSVLTPDKDIVEVSFTSSSALKSQHGLEGYLNYINEIVNKSFLNYTKGVKKSVATSLNLRFDIKKNTAKYKFDNEKKKLEVSSNITKDAGQTQPIYDPGVALSLPVTLGYDLVNSQLKELKNNSYEMFLNDFSVKSKLDVLSSIKPENVNIESFKFQKKPDLPEYKTSPSLKKYIAFAILCSMLFSTLVGMFGIRQELIKNCG